MDIKKLLMKTLQLSLIVLLGVVFFSCGNSSITTGKWKASYTQENKGVNIEKDAQLVFNNIYASYRLGDKLITTKDYADNTVKVNDISDKFGKASVLQITYSDNDLPTLVQSFYIYPDKDYILTEFTLESSADISSNYMAPVNIDNAGQILGTGDNRALFIPFDNDCWIRYQSHPLAFDSLRSYEVTSIFNNDSRNGLVIGSIEHDSWKTGIDIGKSTKENIGSLTCFGGVADSLTRDSKQHGALIGKIIKSPKIFIGYFNDWRDGLEEYGRANAAVAPPKAWDKAIPFGWNSWGVLQFQLTYTKALEVSDYFKENLQNNNFVNPDKTVFIGLDSGWNEFTEEELKAFVQKCKDNGQVAGIYWTPFTDWGKNPERTVQDVPEYKYKDIYIYANGNPQQLDGAYAVDPTHPAIEQQMKIKSELFRRCGFEYVKMDFMTHGAMEADTWYKKDIQTGVQAYNYGMELLNKYFGDMYLNLSISPTFPSQYAQSRRIACDAWNKIKDTEYTMNAVSYGWWIDNVYQYNDADHIVLQEATDGENRARVTSAVITGLYITGDDFSKGGSKEGKEKAMKYLTNAEVNAIATGRSFRPVEGNGAKSENQFIRKDTEGNLYYVIFNYSEENITMNVPFERVGLDTAVGYKAKELWSGDNIDLKSSLTIPAKDVVLIKISEL
ncbi:alpha-galactosidase [Dysgonomonas macrotermitis]|uniref:Alpha-galactosidase n=2 Tax=Dysgonomonas macrotermitis TaxID=1346286 RepID=A0A1M4Y0F9_9BACT|nr:alpha-galactosidase [Dysgonomonas macrotermitis]